MAVKQRMWKEWLKKRLDINHESHLRGLDMSSLLDCKEQLQNYKFSFLLFENYWK